MTEQIQSLEITPANMCEVPVCGIKDREHEGRRAKERYPALPG